MKTDKNYMKSALVSHLTELLWTTLRRNFKNTRKMVKMALWLLSPGIGWRA